MQTADGDSIESPGAVQQPTWREVDRQAVGAQQRRAIGIPEHDILRFDVEAERIELERPECQLQPVVLCQPGREVLGDEAWQPSEAGGPTEPDQQDHGQSGAEQGGAPTPAR